MVKIFHGQMLKHEFLKDQFKYSLVTFLETFFSNPKLFAGDTYLLSVLREITYLELI